ncbi:thioesterase [Zhengella mangrovi]|uniref:Thioesterase n=1 Tax=Zhengella mangrovi TaxID=1982044 RepID=A0A2G1QR20_9HYPH|nr:thioesterase family protein [Zhengella mangrovi]PHP67668.1 thioesterase [Zhengella mangrovi]
MSKPTEDEKVFTHEIRVGWADCDPAQIAYTGRIPYFALEAIDAWWDAKVGDDWFRMNIDKGYGTPFVHLSVDFRSPVTPRHRLQCQVRLMRLGDSSIRFSVEGYQDGTLCFEGQFVEVFVDAKTHLTKIKAPDFVREKVAHLALDA